MDTCFFIDHHDAGNELLSLLAKAMAAAPSYVRALPTHPHKGERLALDPSNFCF